MKLYKILKEKNNELWDELSEIKPNGRLCQFYSKLEKELKIIFQQFGAHFKDIDFGYFYNDKFDLIKKIEKTA